MSTGPQDIAHLAWRRRASDAWTSAAFRAPVLTFLDAFVRSRSWASAWEVVERFADTGITAKIPRVGPYQPPEADDFAQRPGVRLLVLRATRGRDRYVVEVGLSFPNGSETDPQILAMHLENAALSLDAENRRHPVDA